MSLTIDDFIDIVVPKLKMPVAKGTETIDGSTLKLTGYKSVRGEPIQDHKLYKIPTPIVVNVDHKRKLSLAWLRGGKVAVRNYLSKYLKQDHLEKVIKFL